jgi:transcriptional regulator with XRE-family HTH domain
MIHPSQIRGARAILELSQSKLAELAGVSAATVKRIESTAEIRGAADTLWKIEKALKTAGVEFIDADDIKGPGVRLKVVPQVAQLKNRGAKGYRRERRRQK